MQQQVHDATEEKMQNKILLSLNESIKRDKLPTPTSLDNLAKGFSQTCSQLFYSELTNETSFQKL